LICKTHYLKKILPPNIDKILAHNFKFYNRQKSQLEIFSVRRSDMKSPMPETDFEYVTPVQISAKLNLEITSVLFADRNQLNQCGQTAPKLLEMESSRF